MPYWQYRVLPLARDQAGSGKGSGSAMEERSAWMVAAAAVMPFAPTLKMHLWSALAVVRPSACPV